MKESICYAHISVKSAPNCTFFAQRADSRFFFWEEYSASIDPTPDGKEISLSSRIHLDSRGKRKVGACA